MTVSPVGRYETATRTGCAPSCESGFRISRSDRPDLFGRSGYRRYRRFRRFRKADAASANFAVGLFGGTQCPSAPALPALSLRSGCGQAAVKERRSQAVKGRCRQGTLFGSKPHTARFLLLCSAISFEALNWISPLTKSLYARHRHGYSTHEFGPRPLLYLKGGRMADYQCDRPNVNTS